ncbi:MAG: uracil-DNA glycosylase, partial [Rhodocyclaceae bacterium]|nr:uracil-DNA glycosylase [Rhodocyclaceae bacterium]
MNSDQILKEMGLGPIWKLRQPPKKKQGAASVITEPVDARTGAIAALGWDELPQAVADCQACALCKTRQQAVLGVGDRAADWLFVGEGPGADEDERG